MPAAVQAGVSSPNSSRPTRGRGLERLGVDMEGDERDDVGERRAGRGAAPCAEELLLVDGPHRRDPARILVERRDPDDVVEARAGELADLLDAV